MQVRCIRAFGNHVPGDVAEVPDGASVDPEHWEPVTAPPAPQEVAGLLDGLAERVIPGKEGM